MRGFDLKSPFIGSGTAKRNQIRPCVRRLALHSHVCNIDNCRVIMYVFGIYISNWDEFWNGQESFRVFGGRDLRGIRRWEWNIA